MRTSMIASVVLALVVLTFAPVQADSITHGGTTVNMAFIDVGNAGNGPDDTTYGAVGYNYRIGTYEVTASQWAAVLAAAPGVGNAGSTTGSKPANSITWFEAARFCNWLTTGNVDSGVYNTTTWDVMDHQTAGTTYGKAYFIPTENEWYKAAFYDPAKDGGAGGYWNYTTGGDTAPTPTTVAAQLNVAPGSANYASAVGTVTDVGSYSLKPSTSPYGTFDQGGNVWEWNETWVNATNRGARGGCYYSAVTSGLASSYRNSAAPTHENAAWGFRVASIVPEPGSLVMLAGVAMMALLYYWRKHE